MTIFDRLGHQVGSFLGNIQAGRQKALQFENPATWLRETGAAHSAWSPDLGMVDKQQELYQRLSWVSTAVGHVANQAAGVKLEVMRTGSDEELAEQDSHEFEKLLQKPNPAQSRYEFLQAVYSFYALTGNSYTWLNKSNENAPPAEMWVIPSSRIRPIPDRQLYVKGYMYDPGNGVEVPLEPWEVMHWKSFNPQNRYIGLSPIEALATVSVGDMKMQEWITNFFGENNAKTPGILAFAEAIPDAEWQRIQNDFKEQHGGTKRNFMMLRNTGAGGVDWTATNMSQSDMEFLASRQFNKEEIYAKIAPGLASWLDVNSTEANSKTGRDAFFELGVWPHLEALGQKFTNDIMPVYGEDLIAQFEDIRPVDRLLKLQEQQAFERTHTVEEVRKEVYGDDPLGDERDTVVIGLSNPADRPDFEPEEDNPDEDKDKEKEQFKAYAEKRVREGKYAELDKFEFHFLGADEQRALKAEVNAPTMLLDNLVKMTDAVRQAV